jgi:hypothetical protein
MVDAIQTGRKLSLVLKHKRSSFSVEFSGLDQLYVEEDVMKKLLALGGLVAAPALFLALPLLPQVVLVLVSAGFGAAFFTLTQAAIFGLAAVLGVLLGGGNVTAALIALA